MEGYITKDTALDAIATSFETMAEAENYVKNLPVVDVVKVVRCKNCSKWCVDEYPRWQYAPEGSHFCETVYRLTLPDWFCGDGKMRMEK